MYNKKVLKFPSCGTILLFLRSSISIMAKESVSTKKKRSSLIKRLLVFIGLVIIAINLVQYLLIMSNARKNIVAEDIDMYRNMSEGYASALENELEGYFKELNGYVFADIMETGDLELCYEWIMDPEHRDMHGEFDYIMLSGPDGRHNEHCRKGLLQGNNAAGQGTVR